MLITKQCKTPTTEINMRKRLKYKYSTRVFDLIEICVCGPGDDTLSQANESARFEVQLRHRIIIASTNVLHTFPCRIKRRRGWKCSARPVKLLFQHVQRVHAHASAFPRIEFGPAKFESRESTVPCFIAGRYSFVQCIK